MNVPLSARLLGGVLAAGSAAGPAAAQMLASTTSYIVTSIGATTAGPVAGHELLTLQHGTAGSRVALAEPDGTVVSLPARFTAEGEIAARSGDGGITCYNMAMDVLARQSNAGSAPATVLLRFGSSVVAVPLVARAVQTQGRSRTVALDGVSSGTFDDGTTAAAAGIFVSAAVETDGTGLRGAIFDETRFIGSRDNVVGHSTCTLQRTQTAATKRV